MRVCELGLSHVTVYVLDFIVYLGVHLGVHCFLGRPAFFPKFFNQTIFGVEI